MRLGKNWHKIWRYYSTQAMVIAGIVQTTWVSIPADMRNSVPEDLVSYGTMGLLVLGVIGRAVSQDDS